MIVINNNKNKSAFTLVEIMVSLAIIAIITTGSLMAFGQIRQQGRDTRRLTDIRVLQAALSDYYRDEGSYPASLSAGMPLTGSTSNKTYLIAVPLNPAPRDDKGCPDQDYSYQPLNNNSNYIIDFCIAKKSGDIPGGVLSAGPDSITACINTIWNPSTSGICGSILQSSNCGQTRMAIGDITCSAPLSCGGGGVANQCGCTAETDAHFCARLNTNCGSLSDTDNCGQARTVADCGSCTGGQICDSGACADFMCGIHQILDLRDSQTYPTVQIGTQCWMTKNMNIGTMVTGTTTQTNNAIIEKYCYSNDISNCTTDGGLYQWDEAMQYSVAELAQGICPDGWHIPTDAEQNTLDQLLNDTTCDANRVNALGCANAGTKLKTGGTSGFEGLMAGYTTGGVFFNQGVHTRLWSSTISESNVWFRNLYTNYTAVGRYLYSPTYGFSVRCLKD